MISERTPSILSSNGRSVFAVFNDLQAVIAGASWTTGARKPRKKRQGDSLAKATSEWAHKIYRRELQEDFEKIEIISL